MSSIASSASSAGQAEFASPKRQRVLTALLQCHLCGETCGRLESPGSAGLSPIARFSSADGSQSRRHEAAIDLALDKPRRGRPPRWLVELRARQEAA